MLQCDTYLKNFLDFWNHEFFDFLCYNIGAKITDLCLHEFEAAASSRFITS